MYFQNRVTSLDPPSHHTLLSVCFVRCAGLWLDNSFPPSSCDVSWTRREEVGQHCFCLDSRLGICCCFDFCLFFLWGFCVLINLNSFFLARPAGLFCFASEITLASHCRGVIYRTIKPFSSWCRNHTYCEMCLRSYFRICTTYDEMIAD